jgi:hypothetical protein
MPNPSTPPDLLRNPPLRVVPNITLAEETRAIELARHWLSTEPAPMQATLSAIATATCWPDTHPLLHACTRIAMAVDAGELARPLPFHNSLHFCEVMLGANYLGLLRVLPPDDHRLLVSAAAIHDIGHDGRTNGERPFRLESQALALAAPYLAAAQVARAQVDRLAALVLATDIAHGLPRARQWFAHFFCAAPQPGGEEPVASFKLFADDPRLAQLAIALAEADALASAGLSQQTADEQEAHISTELGGAPSARGKLTYLERALPDGFQVASRFNPNLEAIRARARSAANMTG